MKAGRLPDFVGLGTQKGGTTTLYELLNKHPQIYLPECKEVHYFDINYHESLEWYASHFIDVKEDELCGEITPYYLFHHKAAKRIHELLPNAKLIILLRDPVERTLSHIFHAQRRGFETLNLEKSIQAEEKRLKSRGQDSMQKHSYVARSKYLEQIDRYEILFPKKNILIQKSETLFNEPNRVWEKVLNFLNLDYYPIPAMIPRANKGTNQAKEVSKSIREELRERLTETYYGIERKYGITWHK